MRPERAAARSPAQQSYGSGDELTQRFLARRCVGSRAVGHNSQFLTALTCSRGRVMFPGVIEEIFRYFSRVLTATGILTLRLPLNTFGLL